MCPDIVGRGQSENLRDPTHYALPQYVQDMMGVLSMLDGRQVDWVGTSMGGLIGMVLAAQPGNPIRRLVLNDVGPFLSADAVAGIAALVSDDVFGDVSEARSAIAEALGGWGLLPEGGLDHLLEFSIRRRPDGTIGRSYDPAIAVPMRKTEPGPVDLWPVWQAVSCPTLVLRGQDSLVLSRETAQQMAERSDVQVIEIAGCGHAPSLMMPDQIEAVRAWLDA